MTTAGTSNTDAQTSNAQVTVTYQGKTVTFDLSGTELSETIQHDGSSHTYLNNASRGFIADQVEHALRTLTRN